MYLPGQIVWSLDHNKPVKIPNDVWDTKSYPGKTTHFINSDGKAIDPETIQKAKLLLKQRRIVVAPLSSEWCWSCDDRLSNKPKVGCEAEDEHIHCAECNGFGIYATRIGKRICRGCCNKLEKDGLRVVAEELMKEIALIDHSPDVVQYNPSKVSKLIEQLRELDDPYNIKKDGEFRDKLNKLVRGIK